MTASCRVRTSLVCHFFRVFGAAAFILLLPFALTAAWAVDVPFKLQHNSATYEGIATLQGNRLTAQTEIGGRTVNIEGEIAGDTISVTGYGLVDGGRICIGTASPVSGDVTVRCLDYNADLAGILYLKLPHAGPSAGTAAASSQGTPPPSQTVTITQPSLDPIEDTYIAIRPAKVHEKPDVTTARIKTVAVGQKIYVMGKVKGQGWFLVSENEQPLGYVAADQLVPEAQYHPAVALAAPTVPAAVVPAPAPTQPAIPPALANLDFGRYEALVIGNDRYQSGLPTLQTAANDAQAISRTLKSSYGFRVTTLVNATRNQIIGALARLRQTLTWDDNLLIYYAGHGTFDQAGNQGYWLPVDAARDDPSNWVSNTDITTMLKAIQARHVLVVADSCYSGTLTRDANIGVKDADYIQRMVQKKARTVMTSGGLEPVADSGGSGHSVFASAFIAALQQNNGVMDAQSFFAKVREPVVLAAPQTPEYSNLRFAGHEGGDFVFVRKP